MLFYKNILGAVHYLNTLNYYSNTEYIKLKLFLKIPKRLVFNQTSLFDSYYHCYIKILRQSFSLCLFMFMRNYLLLPEPLFPLYAELFGLH